jgi:cyclopropane fatty-acyl-phospholipid synthase-like methyltransferase
MPSRSAPSVYRNREVILDVLKLYIDMKGELLEIGSGTGEHGVFFAEHFNELNWHLSDCSEHHEVIKEWMNETKLKNLKGPHKLKIGEDDFPKKPFDYVFTANTLHIMSWKEGKTLFKLLGKRLREGSLCFFYGPFNYNGDFTSQSNREFQDWLQQRNPSSGIRNFEDVVAKMKTVGFKLLKDHEMPANNRLLVFERLSHSI